MTSLPNDAVPQRLDYTGLVIGPWLVVERFRTKAGRSAFRCVHLELDRVVGIESRRLGKKIRDGAVPTPVSAWRHAEALLRVQQDTAARELIKVAG